MNTTCNYRCSYCTQRFVEDRKQWARDLPRFIESFSKLPGDWEIKLSGGEPFRHPHFEEFVQQMVQRGRRISVVTNFSASTVELEQYAKNTQLRPGVFSASLHLEYANPEEFAEKLSWFASIHQGTVVATCVATQVNLPRLPSLISLFKQHHLNLRIQPEKQDRDVVAYTENEREQLLAFGGHNGIGLIEPDFYGRLCWAGARYFIVDHRGEAFRCYPARRFKKEYLGNFIDGSFRLNPQPVDCQYHYCNCTVPIQRGMIAGTPAE